MNPVLRKTSAFVSMIIVMAFMVCLLATTPAISAEDEENIKPMENVTNLEYLTTFTTLATQNIDNLGYKAPYADFGPPDSVFESNGPWHQWVEMLQPKDSFLSNKFNTVDDRVHVYLGEFLTFDDNIFQTEKDETHDTIRTQIAGMDLRSERFEGEGEATENKYYFQLLTEFRFEDYYRHADQDHSEFDIAPQFSYKINELLQVNYQGGYRKSASSTDRTLADTILHYRSDSIINIAITPSDRWGVEVAGLFRDKYYPVAADGLFESREYAAMIAPYYQYSDNLKLGVDITVGEVDYDHEIQNDAEYGEGRVSALYTYENWTYYLAVGYHNRDYDTTGTDPDTTDYENVIFNSSIRYTDPDYKWDVGLLASLLPVETSASNYTMLNRYSIDASYIPIDPLRFRTEVFAEYSNQSNFWDTNRNGVSTSVTWSFCDYAATGVSYQHVRTISDAPDSDTISNLVSVGLWFTF